MADALRAGAAVAPAEGQGQACASPALDTDVAELDGRAAAGLAGAAVEGLHAWEGRGREPGARGQHLSGAGQIGDINACCLGVPRAACCAHLKAEGLDGLVVSPAGRRAWQGGKRNAVDRRSAPPPHRLCCSRSPPDSLVPPHDVVHLLRLAADAHEKGAVGLRHRGGQGRAGGRAYMAPGTVHAPPGACAPPHGAQPCSQRQLQLLMCQTKSGAPGWACPQALAPAARTTPTWPGVLRRRPSSTSYHWSVCSVQLQRVGGQQAQACMSQQRSEGLLRVTAPPDNPP